MQYKVFTIPIMGGETVQEEMNRFLRGNKVVDVEKQLITINNNAYWSFCVQYIYGIENKIESNGERREKVDYKSVLDEATFARFSKLRAIRKQIAEQDAIPAYAVFTDAELAELAKLNELTEKSMLSVYGIGEKKVKKYGELLCQMMNDTAN